MARLTCPGRSAVVAIVALLLVSAGAADAGIFGIRTRMQAMRDRIEARVKGSGAEVSVAYRRLKGGEELLIRPDVAFHAASTMKVPVMIELFRQAKAGLVRLDAPMPVQNQFRSIVDGSPYTLSVSDDSDGEVYKAIGKTMTPRQLCEAMITVSSNLAANILIDRLGPRAIQKTTDDLGAKGMRVLRGVEDDTAFAKGLNNETTARALLLLLEAIAKGRAVDRQASSEMRDVLQRQHFNDGIPAGVPPGTPVAHKTGTITAIYHDAGIVYGRKPYVLVVLTRGLQEEQAAQKLIADISRVVWEANK